MKLTNFQIKNYKVIHDTKTGLPDCSNTLSRETLGHRRGHHRLIGGNQRPLLTSSSGTLSEHVSSPLSCLGSMGK